jgi:beta-phosphoglucomutase-like phosphatase (HAD superfamily)
VLFDCDGVRADSEGLVNRMVTEAVTARGWRMTGEQARETFLGMALPDMVPVIEARTGPLPPRWGQKPSERIARALREEVEPIPGAVAAVRAVAAGCRVLGFVRETEAAILTGLGAEPFFAMEALPGLLGLGSSEGRSGC